MNPVPKRPCSARCLGQRAQHAAGTVGWPPDGPRDGAPHAAATVCASPAHQRDAAAWVAAITGHPGQYRPYTRATKETDQP